MSEYFFHLTVGDYYLQIDVDQFELQQRLEKWFHFINNTSSQNLGKISIMTTIEDLSANQQNPVKEWLDQTCQYSGRGCKGIIHPTKPAQQ